MASGRKRVPPNLKVIQGTVQPGRAEPELDESQLLQAAPGAPQYLNVDGKDMWDSVTKRMSVAKVLQEEDLYLIEQACYAWQRFRQKAVAGMPITASEDNAMKAMFSELGMSPASRLKAGAGAGESKKNRFANNGRA